MKLDMSLPSPLEYFASLVQDDDDAPGTLTGVDARHLSRMSRAEDLGLDEREVYFGDRPPTDEELLDRELHCQRTHYAREAWRAQAAE